MEKNEESSRRTAFRFTWYLLAEAEFFFESIDSVYCIFSRAFLWDYSLLKKGAVVCDCDRNYFIQSRSSDEERLGDSLNARFDEAGKLASDLEKLSTESADTLPSVHKPEKQSNPSEVQEESDSDEAKAMASLGLPTVFAGIDKKKIVHKSKNRTRSRLTPSWMIGLSFEGYWDAVGEFIINKTWLHDFGAYMDENTFADCESRLAQCKPKHLLPAHRSLSKFEGIVFKKNPNTESASWEELYALHCSAIQEQVKRDFTKFRNRGVIARCKEFFSQIEELGFVPGFEGSSVCDSGKVDIAMLNDSSSTSSDSERDEKDSSTSQERKQGEKQLSTFNDMEMFTDLCFDVYVTSNKVTRLVLERDTDRRGSCITDEKNMGTDHQFSEHYEAPLSSEEKMNFDFGFDGERDAHLIAADAANMYKGDPEIRKYWYQRYRLFSKLDEGVLMDREGWFSVTPERIAEHIADRMVLRDGAVIVDAFAGVGGNSIQLALKGAHVVAIDLDPVRLRCAAQNARVYGVEDRINFVCADFFHFVKSFTAHDNFTGDEEGDDIYEKTVFDAVFLSPPWGGPSYLQIEVFDLNSDLTPNGFEIYAAAKKLSSNIAYYLPRNACIKQLISLAGEGGSCEVEHSMLNKKVKTITAYYGNLVARKEESG